MNEQENALTDPVLEKDCCICGKRDDMAHEFEFHYGNKIGKENTSKTDLASHKIKGNFKGYICHACFKKNHMLPVYIGVTSMMTVFSGSLWFMQTFELTSYPLGLSFLYLIIGYGIYQTFSIVRKYNKSDITVFVIDDGAKILIKNFKKDLIAKGYDTFWTPDEYNQMLKMAEPKTEHTT